MMEGQVTDGGVAIKIILDLEQENKSLKEDLDYLKYMNSFIRKQNIDLSVEIIKRRYVDEDMNLLMFFSVILISAFYWMVIYG